MRLLQVILAITFLLFTVTGFAARQEKILICHVGNELGPNGEEYDSTCVPEEANGYCSADAGKIDLILVPENAKHLGNPSHEYGGISDYEPGDVGASGDGTEDSNGDGIDDGCEPPEACPCWDEVELLSVTADNNLTDDSCSAVSFLPTAALIQNDEFISPTVEGGFAAINLVDGAKICGRRDFEPSSLDITAEEADACIAQIAARCAAIGDPIPTP